MISIAIIAESEQEQLELKHFINAQPNWRCSYTSNSLAFWEEKIGTNGSVDIILIVINENVINRLVSSQLRKIKQAHPKTEFLTLVDGSDIKKVITWLRYGVVGYLPRDTPFSELNKAILIIHQGGAYIHTFILRQLLNFFQAQEDFEEVLTEKEKEIVQGLVEGLSYKLIACKLNITLDTVRYHLRNIYKKLYVNSKSQVISKVAISELKL